MQKFIQESSAYDVSKELLIEPHLNGVRLIKPETGSELNPSIKEFYHNQFSSYFHNIDSKATSYNETNPIIFGSISENDLLNKTPDKYADNDLSKTIIRNNNAVIDSKNLIIREESGKNLAGEIEICGISFKYPWYHHDKIIGVFGYSVVLKPFDYIIDTHKIEQILLSSNLTKMLYRQRLLPGKSYGGIYFTKREAEVLTLTLQRCTAKETAKTLHLSFRTVEHYLERLKIKLNVTSKAALIEKARLLIK